MARDGFSRLPFSREEATAIASLAGRRDVFSALDFAANRSTVLGGGLRGYRVVDLPQAGDHARRACVHERAGEANWAGFVLQGDWKP